jgi:hypothetical protein
MMIKRARLLARSSHRHPADPGSSGLDRRENDRTNQTTPNSLIAMQSMDVKTLLQSQRIMISVAGHSAPTHGWQSVALSLGAGRGKNPHCSAPGSGPKCTGWRERKNVAPGGDLRPWPVRCFARPFAEELLAVARRETRGKIRYFEDELASGVRRRADKKRLTRARINCAASSTCNMYAAHLRASAR